MSIIVPGIVLAAGRSRRMGRAKALLPAGSSGETFIDRIVRVLRDSGIDDVLIVVADGRLSVTQALTSAEPSVGTTNCFVFFPWALTSEAMKSQ